MLGRLMVAWRLPAQFMKCNPSGPGLRTGPSPPGPQSLHCHTVHFCDGRPARLSRHVHLSSTDGTDAVLRIRTNAGLADRACPALAEATVIIMSLRIVFTVQIRDRLDVPPAPLLYRWISVIVQFILAHLGCDPQIVHTLHVRCLSWIGCAPGENVLKNIQQVTVR